MLPWLLNLYMDGKVRGVQARTLGREAHLVGYGEEMWEVSHLIFTDYTVLVAASKKRLERLVEEFGWVSRRRKIKVNVVKSKVMRSAEVVFLER